MPQEMIEILNSQFVYIIALVIGGIIGMGIERHLSKQRRRAWHARNWSRWSRRGTEKPTAGPWALKHNLNSPKPPDAADQLRIVMGATFTTQPLLNKSEARVFREVDQVVINYNPAWQVMAQVSLGEVLRSKDALAYGCINSKRIDLILMDEKCQPRHAIEYQGAGHHQSTAAARDAVKKEALRRAGVGYHEVVAGHTTPVELRRLIEKLVDPPDK
jgi:hypothetical protein